MSFKIAVIGCGLVLLSACEGVVGGDTFGPGWGPSLVDGAAPDLPDAGPVDSSVPEPPPDAAEPDAGMPDAGPPRIVWKGAVMAGDDSIDAFDNARMTVHGMLLDDGVLPENLIQLSRSSYREDGVLDTSFENLMNGMLGLDVGPGDGCVIFMTSHGSPDGWYIQGRSTLAPRDLDQILDEACGDQPTVVLVSACYSGVFVDPLRQPNRIILTAARSDRTSFGCSAEVTYTYWDGCFVESYPSATTWAELYDAVTACVEAKEAGGFTPSEPQGFFGDDVQDMGIFDRE